MNRFSVVIPTYQRRGLVVAAVRALSLQEFSGRFEVIVVVDGSTDGSAEALRSLALPFRLSVLEQLNQGAASARNAGAAAARGELLLFLDDDMEAHPRLLAEHERSHRTGADVVYGHLPLHIESPANFLSANVRRWADSRLARLSAPGAPLTLHDLMTGQMSLSREVFNRMGGFDTRFTSGGTFGDEDVDFGYRLMRAGHRLVFNGDAISWQRYVVQPCEYLRQWRQAGRADVAFARKHPEAARALFQLNGSDGAVNRWFWRPLVSLSPVTLPLMALLRRLALGVAAVAQTGRWAEKLFYAVWAMEYWRGVAEAGGMPRSRAVRVLVYHAIQDLRHAPVVGPYAVAPSVFGRQLDVLQRLGFAFITPDEFLRFLQGSGALPRRPLLLTFDDGYEHMLDTVIPHLAARAIPALVFVVSGRLGGTNEWDEAIGGPRLRLLDADGLRQLTKARVHIGAHSRTHRPLTTLSSDELESELAGSARELEALGLPRPWAFAYPEGQYDSRVLRAARDAGIQVAFTTARGKVLAGDDPLRIPRLEVLSGDGVAGLLWKVMTARRVRSEPPDPRLTAAAP